MSSQRNNSDVARRRASDVVFDSPRIKILTLGDVGVGKSCFVKYFCESRFVSKYIPTIGIDYGVKKFIVQPALLESHRAQRALSQGGSASQRSSRELDVVSSSQQIQSVPPSSTSSSSSPPFVHVNFWDVAGGSESLEVRNEFYDATQGIVLMYDVRNTSSFDALDLWWDELGSYIPLPTNDSKMSNSNDHGNNQFGGSAQDSASRVCRRASTTSYTAAGKLVGTNKGRAPIVILCANKVDDLLAVGDGGGVAGSSRVSDSVPPAAGGSVKRAVTEEQGRDWARRHGCVGYYETSASSGLNVNIALNSLIYSVIATFM